MRETKSNNDYYAAGRIKRPHERQQRETEVQEREKMTWSFHLPHPLLPALPLGLDDALHDLSRSLSSLSRSADGPRGMYCDPEYGLGGGGG